ncbi:phosphoglucomutase [Nesidiocoris tenuis]|uniref:phosphoglucomutase (alpha-D-glucose-1,6-bisphosphate-dependent) n=1 Tax=Nesidiocoris tenuis TaxID=355587 RepID=A0ABN7B205_9HEMI|nr:phosphoglucomutase [Nesidiocoris tenuis]
MNCHQNWIENEVKIKHKIVSVGTTPFPDQWLDVNFPIEGLSSCSESFIFENYVENFCQAALNVLKLEGRAISVGGIGNNFCNDVLKRIARVAAGNGITKIFTGTGGCLTRPAMAILTGKTQTWGFLLHKSCHTFIPGTEDGFSIDILTPQGCPASPDFLEEILVETQTIVNYKSVPTINFCFDIVSETVFKLDTTEFSVSVVDAISMYKGFLRQIFDFQKIRNLFNADRPFTILIDSENGSTGPYLKRIFEDEFLCPEGSIINEKPNENASTFDLAQIQSKEIVKTFKSGSKEFGALLDSDGSRCVIFCQNGLPVPAGEILSQIVLHHHAVPYFQLHDFHGIGRSYSTPSSVDDLVENSDLNLVITSGNAWFTFNRMMKNDILTVCEDDTFRVGSKILGVSDGIWTILLWLSLIAHLHKPIRNILIDHWSAEGRYVSTIYEYRNIPNSTIRQIVRHLSKDGFTRGRRTEHFGVLEKYGDRHLSYAKFEEEMAFQDSILQFSVEPNTKIIFKTMAGKDSGIFQIVAEAYKEESSEWKNTEKVTQFLFLEAVEIANIGHFLERTTPDFVY